MRTAAAFLALFAAVFAARLCHSKVVWVEEAYPLAAAMQMSQGEVLYRDIWFDKPPWFAQFYALLDAPTGWRLRLAGALLVTLCCWCAFLLARRFWTSREGLYAAGLLGFFLTFGIPAAVMVVGPDLLTVAPHLLAVLFCLRGDPFRAGICGGVGLMFNPKAPFVLLACLIWQWRKAGWLALGAAAVQVPAILWMHYSGALPHYWEQVWAWGFLYSSDSPYTAPWLEGLRRTANWMGFHAALVVAAGALWFQERSSRESRRLALWALISLAAVAAGWRFFPRYYFHLLTPMAVIAARGMAAVRYARLAALVLLLIPLVRFGPRYIQMAEGRPWADLALHDDARQAAQLLPPGARSLLVWGYRPEVYVYSRIAAATPFLDSQPLTGVLADRHLSTDVATAPEIAKRNRSRLVAYDPAFIVDGLGPMNARLAITAYPDLENWMRRYEVVGRTKYSVIYGLRNGDQPVGPPKESDSEKIGR